MSKTAPINDDVHALIVDKQTELKRKYKVIVKISDLIALYVRHGVDATEELLGFKAKEKPYVTDKADQGDIDNQEIKTTNGDNNSSIPINKTDT